MSKGCKEKTNSTEKYPPDLEEGHQIVSGFIVLGPVKPLTLEERFDNYLEEMALK